MTKTASTATVKAVRNYLRGTKTQPALVDSHMKMLLCDDVADDHRAGCRVDGYLVGVVDRNEQLTIKLVAAIDDAGALESDPLHGPHGGQ